MPKEDSEKSSHLLQSCAKTELTSRIFDLTKCMIYDSQCVPHKDSQLKSELYDGTEDPQMENCSTEKNPQVGLRKCALNSFHFLFLRNI